jgi:DNA-binding MarR family transcriptional regulator
MIPPPGIRITDLAATAGMTTQALGEFVDWLEEAGFVASRRDEHDRRVRLVSRTGRGDAAAEAGARAIAAVERNWQEEIGAERFEVMMQALRDLGRHVIGRGAGQGT